MHTNAPYLTQLTVNDEGISGFTQILFTQAEQEWFGCWDINPAIFIRTKHSFEEVHYHLRKFIHLYKEETEKWYFSDSTTHRYWWLICIILNMTQRV